MLKKRILASSLASVMALSSVSVVAFADETATAGYGETVTRPELKEYLKTCDDLINGDINNYGSVQAVRFQEAYDHAAYVAADAEATETDFIAAYQMLKAVRDKLQQFTNEQLKELLDECKPTYDRNNILNEEINDYIYNEDAFATFRSAYDDAESVVEVDDLMIVTDAYITLDDAYKALEANKKTPVHKTEYRAVIKEYEAMIKQFSKYEKWRRGTVSVNPTTGSADDAKIYLKNATYVTWKELQNIVFGASTVEVVTEVELVDGTTAKDDKRTDLATGSDTWIAVSSGAIKTVEAYLYEQSKIFDDYKAASKTTDDDIKGAYDAAKEAIAVFKSWKPIDADSTVKGEATKTLNKYRTQLANDFEKTLINSLVVSDGSVTGLSFDSDGDTAVDSAALKYEDGKLLGVTGAGKAGCTLRIDSGTGLIQLNKTPTDADYADAEYAPSEITGRKSYTIKIADGVDYMKYIPVRSGNVKAEAGKGIETDSTTAPAKVARVQAAIKLLEDTNIKVDAKADAATWTAFYGTADIDATAAVIDNMADLDENTTITQAAGSAREYTFINRYLTYALQDLYPEQSTPCSHTRKDIEKIVEEAYELINKTGVANIFATANEELADARKDAVEWLRESYKNKKYKDNDDDLGKYALGTSGDKIATEVYHTLSDAPGAKYDALDSLLKKYPISYAEIAEKIADVSKKLDAEVYGETVKEALDAVSYALSVLKVTLEGNEAFNEERAFNGYNRLYVASDATAEEKALKTALDNLDKVIEEAGSEADVVKGDADGDGKVTINDALRTLKASIKAVTLSESEMKAADVDGVPGVTALDALAILKMALKIV
ncbi:MAG: dockerin type I repeat-containing protein [Oscillospiraceae bacterium]|nr:dockerin type I repeat-containing protein [Oscillospiraceae bacterium]